MKRLIVLVPALALAVVLSGSAFAADGSISTPTLNAMGLAGIEIMADSAALDVRGHGWRSSRSIKPWSRAYGSSEAEIEIEFGGKKYGKIEFEAETDDGFRSYGRYQAGGSHESGAEFQVKISHTENAPGAGSVTHTKTLYIGIGAGGKAKSYSF